MRAFLLGCYLFAGVTVGLGYHDIFSRAYGRAPEPYRVIVTVIFWPGWGLVQLTYALNGASPYDAPSTTED